jgi:hypothetical protein
MLLKQFRRIDIARQQYETAIFMFLSGRDNFSAITLAAASGEIFHQHLINQKQETFVDYARALVSKLKGIHPKRQLYKSHLAKSTGALHLKHHASEDSLEIELDVDDLVEKALIATLSDYIKIFGHQPPAKELLKWLWVNRDGEKLYKQYLESNSEGPN